MQAVRTTEASPKRSRVARLPEDECDRQTPATTDSWGTKRSEVVVDFVASGRAAAQAG